MKRRILLMCSVCFCMAFSAFSQETTATIHETPAVVLQNAKLHTLSGNINAKEASLLSMTASSRGQVAAATDELAKMRQEYKELLVAQMELTTNTEFLDQLKAEVQYVESKQAVKSAR